MNYIKYINYILYINIYKYINNYFGTRERVQAAKGNSALPQSKCILCILICSFLLWACLEPESQVTGQTTSAAGDSGSADGRTKDRRGSLGSRTLQSPWLLPLAAPSMRTLWRTGHSSAPASPQSLPSFLSLLRSHFWSQPTVTSQALPTTQGTDTLRNPKKKIPFLFEIRPNPAGILQTQSANCRVKHGNAGRCSVLSVSAALGCCWAPKGVPAQAQHSWKYPPLQRGQIAHLDVPILTKRES